MNFNRQPPPRGGGGGPAAGQQIIRLPEPQEVGGLVVRNVTAFARRNKVVTGFYLFGWVFLLFVGSGTRLTMQQQSTYNNIMKTIDVQAEYDATNDYWQARQMYQATKGWFSCDSLCQRNKVRMERAEAALKAIRQEGAARTADAKRSVGILSEVGVGEVKDSFWQYLYQGRQFAKRQSMWDALFIGIRTMTRGRDESWIEYGLKVLMNVLMNFTMGLIMALMFFWWTLWGIVREYEPNPLFATIVFVAAAAAGFSYVISYIMAIYGAAAGGVYGVLKLAETAHRAQIAQEQQRQRVGYNNNNRPHYD